MRWCTCAIVLALLTIGAMLVPHFAAKITGTYTQRHLVHAVGLTEAVVLTVPGSPGEPNYLAPPPWIQGNGNGGGT